MSSEERGLDVDHRAGDGREACDPPFFRKHEDYRKPHWATCHVDSVDNLYAAASTGAPIESEPQVRIDADGLGTREASLHDGGENISVCLWISRDQIDEFIEQLEAAREDGRNRVWGDSGGGQ